MAIFAVGGVCLVVPRAPRLARGSPSPRFRRCVRLHLSPPRPRVAAPAPHRRADGGGRAAAVRNRARQRRRRRAADARAAACVGRRVVGLADLVLTPGSAGARWRWPSCGPPAASRTTASRCRRTIWAARSVQFCADECDRAARPRRRRGCHRPLRASRGSRSATRAAASPPPRRLPARGQPDRLLRNFGQVPHLRRVGVLRVRRGLFPTTLRAAGMGVASTAAPSAPASRQPSSPRRDRVVAPLLIFGIVSLAAAVVTLALPRRSGALSRGGADCGDCLDGLRTCRSRRARPVMA